MWRKRLLVSGSVRLPCFSSSISSQLLPVNPRLFSHFVVPTRGSLPRVRSNRVAYPLFPCKLSLRGDQVTVMSDDEDFSPVMYKYRSLAGDFGRAGAAD